MSRNFFTKAENILALYLPRFLRVAQYYQGLEIRLHRFKESVYSDVYGRHSQKEWREPEELIGVVTATGSYPVSPSFAPTFEEGYFYTTDKRANVGDIISIKRLDSKGRKFTLESKEAVGSTQQVWVKFRITQTEESLM